MLSYKGFVYFQSMPHGMIMKLRHRRYSLVTAGRLRLGTRPPGASLMSRLAYFVVALLCHSSSLAALLYWFKLKTLSPRSRRAFFDAWKDALVPPAPPVRQRVERLRDNSVRSGAGR